MKQQQNRSMQKTDGPAVKLIAAGVAASLLWSGAGCVNYSEPARSAPDYSAAPLAPSIVRIKLQTAGPVPTGERGLNLTLLRVCEVARQRGDSHFAVIDEDASSTGQIVYYPGLAHAVLKPNRGLLVKFFSSEPRGIFSFQARNLQRIMSAQLNLTE